MSNAVRVDPGALRDEDTELFDDLHPRYTESQSLAESDRCLFCYDAPCIRACPAGIDIPAFIRKLRVGNAEGAAHTILQSNIMGGTCARACPTEVLCEEVCVMNYTGEEPVQIGRLQRFAVESHLDDTTADYPFERAPSTGKRVAIVGGGPAGLSCAHGLARLGHDVVVFDENDKLGGLNEYGLAPYKMVGDFAQREVTYLLRIGGISIESKCHVGADRSLESLLDEFDATFVSVGLGNTRTLGISGQELSGVEDAVDFIRRVREADHREQVQQHGSAVVIGGGNTAIDAAIQAKRLGAPRVDLLYRRGPEDMSATQWEQDLAAAEGVFMHFWTRPAAFMGDEGVRSVLVESSQDDSASRFELSARHVYCAIGQLLDDTNLSTVPKEGNKFAVDSQFSTSVPGLFAGGDCVASGDDLTVYAVEHGKQAAAAIQTFLSETDHE